MPTTEKTAIKTKGKIIQIVGVVVDVEFEGHLPTIYNALTVELNNKPLVLEVSQHLSRGSVRTIAMGPTDGLRRGMIVTDTGSPITVPVGDATLGRMFNVVGEAIDGKPEAKAHVHQFMPNLQPWKIKVARPKFSKLVLRSLT